MKHWLLAAGLALGLVGCGYCGPTGGKAAKPEAKKEEPAFVDPGEYYELQKDGRLYIFGSKKSFDQASAMERPHLAASKSFIGRGPGGVSVVIESNGKDKKEVMQARLIGEFNKRHGATLN